VDQNFQCQIPKNGWKNQTNCSSSPIYAHYAGFYGSFPDIPLPVNEAEIRQTMREAELAYENWQRMQKKLKEAMVVFQQQLTDS
jgi:hypothetical protein